MNGTTPLTSIENHNKINNINKINNKIKQIAGR